MPKVKRDLAFLSYASNDIDLIRKIYNELKKRKVEVWFDKNDMKRGKWMPQIKQAIARSKYFIVCLSESAIKKMQAGKGIQKDEFSYAYELAMNQPEDVFCILPVRLEDCERGDHRFTMYQQYDLFPDFEKGIDKIAVDLGGYSLLDAAAKDERTENEKMVAGLIGKSDMFYYSGEFDKAFPFLEAAIKLVPDDVYIWNKKGVVLYYLDRHDEALEAYNIAIEIKSDFAIAWYNKGIVLYNLSRIEDAVEAYSKAIEIKPDDPDAWYNKGNAIFNLGNHDEALEAFNKAIEIKPDFYNAWYGKGYVLDILGRHDEALETYNKAIEIKPDYADAWYNKGVNLGNLSQIEEALEAYMRKSIARRKELLAVKMRGG